MNDTLPRGVSERVGRRMLLEAKLAANDAIAQRSSGDEARRARQLGAEAFDELVDWHRADVRERLGHVAYSHDEAFVTVDGRAIAQLQRSVVAGDPDATGWFVWSVGDQSEADPVSGLALSPALLAAAGHMAGFATDSFSEFVAAVDAPLSAAAAAALDTICASIASDSYASCLAP